MPIYEYQCQKCKTKIEIRQPITAKPLKTHARGCGPLKRLISKVGGFIFKGKGFYATDYQKGDK